MTETVSARGGFEITCFIADFTRQEPSIGLTEPPVAAAGRRVEGLRGMGIDFDPEIKVDVGFSFNFSEST